MFQIVQMDPDAAKWLGFAKQQCKRIMDNGTKDFYREWPLGDATVKAKAYGGTVKLWLVAGGVTDFVGVAMPNPVPYRGVSIGVAQENLVSSAGGSTADYVTRILASDGTVLLHETHPYFQIFSGSPSVLFDYIGAISEYISPAWNGAASMWFIHTRSEYNPQGGYAVLDHISAFDVPEDCIYPVPTTTPPAYIGTDGLSAQWNADWATGVAAFNARRKAWFLKNSTEFIAALKGKFQPGADGVTRAELQTGSIPASWDFFVKSDTKNDYTNSALADGSYAGAHTKMPIIMTITSKADVVVSDTSAGLTQAGTMVTKRTTTFAYTDVDGKAWSVPIDGTLTQVAVQYLPNYDLTIQSTYVNWYNPIFAFRTETFFPHQFLNDDMVHGLGLIWTGVVQQGQYKDSSFNTRGSTLYQPTSPLTYAGYVPTYPAYSNTLVGTAPDIFLQYHNTVIPTYVANTAQSSTVMNNSAMYHVKQVKLRLFAPAPGGASVGLFADPTDADGATQIAYYGEVTLSFDWTTGSITVSKWSPKQDANGNDAPTIINLPNGYSYFNNSGTLYFVESVKSTIAGAGQTPTAAGDAAYTATYNGLPYTVAAKTAGANIVKAAVLAAPPVDPLASPLVASVSNITAALPSAVTAAVAAVLATYSTSPPDATTVKYSILNAIQTLTQAYNCAIGYVWGSQGTMWPDVSEYWKAKNTQLKAGTFDQVLYTVMQGKQIVPPP